MRVAPARTNASLLVSLLLLCVTPAVVLPRQSLAEDGESVSPVSMEKANGPQEETHLTANTLSLEDVLTYAQEHNPTIQAARSRWLAAQERPAQVSALDDPMFTYEGFNIPENFALTRTDNNILKLSQKLPFPGKRRLRGQIAIHEAEISREELRMAEVTLRAEVRKAYYDLWQVHQNLFVYSREKEMMAQFATIAEKKYAVGQVSQPDVLRAQVELTRLITRVTTETLRMEEITGV